MEDLKGKRVLVPVADGTEELEAVTIVDVLRRAGAEVTLAAVGDQRQVTASRGVNLVADRLLGDCRGESYDLIVLPGGIPGVERLRDCPELIVMLKEQAAAGRFYAAICAAPPVVLKTHGLLAARRATCYPDLLEQLGPAGLDQAVVRDGNLLTGQGPGTALEFALALVEALGGEKLRRRVAAALAVRK